MPGSPQGMCKHGPPSPCVEDAKPHAKMQTVKENTERTVRASSVDARTGGLRGRYLDRGVWNDCSWVVAVVSE
jgi:hypothetical protein